MMMKMEKKKRTYLVDTVLKSVGKNIFNPPVMELLVVVKFVISKRILHGLCCSSNLQKIYYVRRRTRILYKYNMIVMQHFLFLFFSIFLPFSKVFLRLFFFWYDKRRSWNEKISAISSFLFSFLIFFFIINPLAPRVHN